MKYFVIVLMLAALYSPVAALEWQGMEEALKDSRENGKKTLLYFKTTWCHYCKKMEAETFRNGDVLKQMEMFNPVKIDIESREAADNQGRTGRDLGAMFKVRGTPNIWFLDSSGNAITSIPGYVPGDKFAEILEYIGTDAYKRVDWKEWQEGKR